MSLQVSAGQLELQQMCTPDSTTNICAADVLNEGLNTPKQLLGIPGGGAVFTSRAYREGPSTN